MNDTVLALLGQAPIYLAGGALVVEACIVRGREARRRDEQEGPPQSVAEWWNRLQ